MKKAILLLIGVLSLALLFWSLGFDKFWGHVMGFIIKLFSHNTYSILQGEKGSALLLLKEGKEYIQTLEDFGFPALALLGWEVMLLFYIKTKYWLRSVLVNIPFLLLLQCLFIGIALPLSNESVHWLDFYISVLPNFIILVFFLVLKDLAIERPGKNK